MRNLLRTPIISVTALLSIVAVCSASNAEEIPFGFDPLEIINVEYRSRYMTTGDVNADGRNDLVIADDSHSRIDVFLQREQSDNAKPGNASKDINFLPGSKLFTHEKLPVKEAIGGILIDDFNNDKNTDIAWLALPNELVISTRSGSDQWKELSRTQLTGISSSTHELGRIDLGNDGRNDIVILGDKYTLLIRQNKDGKFSSIRLTNTSPNPGKLRVGDVNKDGLDDLTYLASGDTDRSFCVRLQRNDGSFQTEQRLEMTNSHDFWLEKFDSSNDVVAIDAATNRIRVRRPDFAAEKTVTKTTENEPPALHLMHHGIETSGSTRDRMLAVGDVNADGLSDVLVNSPDAPHLQLFLQTRELGVQSGKMFPGLVDVKQIAIEPRTDNSPPTIFVISEKEKTLASTVFKNGRLEFPRPISMLGTPKALAFANIDGKPGMELVVICSTKGAPGWATFPLALHVFSREASGEWTPIMQNSVGYALQMKSPSSVSPESMIALDMHEDGDRDLLVSFGTGREPLVIVNDGNGKFSVPEKTTGLKLSSLNRDRLFVSPTTPSFILSAESKFVRQIQMNKDNEWIVSDQFNALEPQSNIACVVALDVDGQPGDEIVQVDTGLNILNILKKQESLFVPWKRFDIGKIDCRSIHVADVNADSKQDMILFAGDRFVVVTVGGVEPNFTEIASYETELDKRGFTQVRTGDLNGDKKVDVTLVDTRSGTIEIIDRDADGQFRRRVNWKVFESKSFRKSSSSGSQPREIVISDVTGDKLDDLILLAHNRVLIYPQEKLPKK